MADLLTLAHFTPYLGSSFRLSGVDGVTLVLTQASLCAPFKKGGIPVAPLAREPFDLIFLGPMSPILPQQIYRFETESMEPLEIFIVPIGPIEGGMGYQAIFN